MKKVMCFGTFDILHPGHFNYFKQALSFGDYLIVVVARDKNILKLKGKKAKNNERIRLKKLEGKVDKVILGNVKNKFKVIEKEKPSVVCFGYDQKVDDDLLKKIKKMRIKTKRLKGYKTSEYKSSLMR